MNDLHKALGDISSIRRQMARTTEFRGYGPATMVATGIFAIVAAGAQALFVVDVEAHRSAFLGIWIATATAAAFLTAVQMHTRARRMHSALSDEMIRTAVEQFVPSAAAGALITAVLVRSAPHDLWILPGLWQVLFSLGVFSSCRFLPKPMVAAGAWYLVSGLVCISLGDARALSPWAMGIPFGVGQLLVAAVLYFGAQEGGDEA